MRIFAIWSEGVPVDDRRAFAILQGIMMGDDFQDACDKLANTTPDFAKHYDRETLTYWGYKLLDMPKERGGIS